MTTQRVHIGVVGSGTLPHTALSQPLGRWIAENGFDLVCGGGRGVMRETARAFSETPNRKGVVIGILPSTNFCGHPEARENYSSPADYPNPYTDIVIRTHLPLTGQLGKDTGSRNHIIVLSSDYIVALPGTEGTQSEIELALEYGKPRVLVSPMGEWQDFADRTEVVDSIEAALEWIARQMTAAQEED